MVEEVHELRDDKEKRKKKYIQGRNTVLCWPSKEDPEKVLNIELFLECHPGTKIHRDKLKIENTVCVLRIQSK